MPCKYLNQNIDSINRDKIDSRKDRTVPAIAVASTILFSTVQQHLDDQEAMNATEKDLIAQAQAIIDQLNVINRNRNFANKQNVLDELQHIIEKDASKDLQEEIVNLRKSTSRQKFLHSETNNNCSTVEIGSSEKQYNGLLRRYIALAKKNAALEIKVQNLELWYNRYAQQKKIDSQSFLKLKDENLKLSKKKNELLLHLNSKTVIIKKLEKQLYGSPCRKQKPCRGDRLNTLKYNNY